MRESNESESNPGPAADDTNMCLSDEQTTSVPYSQPRGQRLKAAVCHNAQLNVMKLKLVA